MHHLRKCTKNLKLAQTANEEESPDSDEACCGLMDVTHERRQFAISHPYFYHFSGQFRKKKGVSPPINPNIQILRF